MGAPELISTISSLHSSFIKLYQHLLMTNLESAPATPMDACSTANELYEKCLGLAGNLWWSWNGDVAAIFRDLDQRGNAAGRLHDWRKNEMISTLRSILP